MLCLLPLSGGGFEPVSFSFLSGSFQHDRTYFFDRIEKDRNFSAANNELTPITETSVEETQMSTDVNDQIEPLIRPGNGSCVVDRGGCGVNGYLNF